MPISHQNCRISFVAGAGPVLCVKTRKNYTDLTVIQKEDFLGNTPPFYRKLLKRALFLHQSCRIKSDAKKGTSQGKALRRRGGGFHKVDVKCYNLL
jgi:hypothetical protein